MENILRLRTKESMIPRAGSNVKKTTSKMRRHAWKLFPYIAFVVVAALFLCYYESVDISCAEIDMVGKLAVKFERLDFVFPELEKNSNIGPCSYEINLYIQFILENEKGKYNKKHLNDLHNMFASLMRNTNCKFTVYVLANDRGTGFFKEMLSNFEKNYEWFISPLVVFVDYYKTSRLAVNYTKPMKELFTTAINKYYSKSLFHLPPGLHQILPSSIEKIMALDIDMLILSDIQYLWKYFETFSTDHIMALVNEQQPVYYHLTNTYREKTSGTNIGKPKPHGKPGLNGGVKLFNLNRMRSNKVYNSLLDHSEELVNLADKYYFKGHLGDQDFYTLLSFEHPDWIMELPCSWNRQLCQWWKNYGYRDIFDLYSECLEPYYILHGNCKTRINHTDFYDFLL